MSGSIQIIGLNDREAWENETRGSRSPTLSWSYASAIQSTKLVPELARIISANSQLRFVFYRQMIADTIHVSSLPGLSGIVAQHGYIEAIKLWQYYGNKQNWVTGYMQLPTQIDKKPLPESMQRNWKTNIFSVEPGAWNLYESTSQIIRRKIKAAIRQGVKVNLDVEKCLAALKNLYPLTLQRFGVAPRYSNETIERLYYSTNALLVGVEFHGKIEGVHLILIQNQAAELHLVGTSETGRSASALLYRHTIELLNQMGITYYNLGGGGCKGEGLYEFKTRLGAMPVPLYDLQIIFNKPKFRQICEDSKSNINSLWFPPYAEPTFTI